MKRLSWKYIAGLIDADGCIDLQLIKDKKTGEYKYVRPRVRIGLSYPGFGILALLHNSHGGNVHKRNFEGHKNHNPNWSEHRYWTLEGKRARPFLQNIVGHMYIKREQARLAIYTIDHIMGKHVPDSVREHLRDEFKAMKSDPQRLSEKAVVEIQSLML